MAYYGLTNTIYMAHVNYIYQVICYKSKVDLSHRDLTRKEKLAYYCFYCIKMCNDGLYMAFCMQTISLC